MRVVSLVTVTIFPCNYFEFLVSLLAQIEFSINCCGLS
jgi:hypothetical protein